MSVPTLLGLALLLPASVALAQDTVRIPVPGGTSFLEADLYGKGANYIMLAHGGRFAKESWKQQAQVFAGSGFAALAIGFRGDSKNPDGSPGSTGSPVENADDVLAALSYLQAKGATRIAAVGASFGGDAVGDADARSPRGSISRIVFLGSSGGSNPERLSGRKLFIVARDDRNAAGLRLPEIKLHFERAPEPKKLVVLSGSAHAQFLFDTDQGSYVMGQILRFLLEE
jgi:dienelactone hydrolase